MQISKWVSVLVIGLCAACNGQRLGSPAVSPERSAEVSREVQEFAATVERDVRQEGPAAWRKHFSEGREFFMASEGHLQFPDSASAIAGIQGLTRTIKHIELKWSDVRVDVLTPDLAQMGAGWHEELELADGKRLQESGYFTGVIQQRNGRWQFRNAHWSTAAAAAPVP